MLVTEIRGELSRLCTLLLDNGRDGSFIPANSSPIESLKLESSLVRRLFY